MRPSFGHAQVDVLGYSFGGGVALRLAIQHPDRVRRLALVSTTFVDECEELGQGDERYAGGP